MAYKVHKNNNMIISISAIDQSWGDNHTVMLKENEKIYFNKKSGKYVGFKDIFHLYLTTEDDGNIHWEYNIPDYFMLKLEDAVELLTIMYMVDSDIPETYYRGKYNVNINIDGRGTCELVAENNKLKFKYNDMKNLMEVIEEVLLMPNAHHT